MAKAGRFPTGSLVPEGQVAVLDILNCLKDGDNFFVQARAYFGEREFAGRPPDKVDAQPRLQARNALRGDIMGERPATEKLPLSTRRTNKI